MYSRHSRDSNSSGSMSSYASSVDFEYPRPLVKFGKKRSEGSVFDSYQVVRIMGGSAHSTVFQCRRKAKRGQAKHEGMWSRPFQRIDEELCLISLSVNDDDPYTEDSMLQQICEKLDKCKDLRHGNIVRVYEYYERYGKVYMILEQCNGGNLASRFPYSETEVSRIIFKVLSAVRYLHNADIFQLALNIENILFVDDNPYKMDVKLADFGIAHNIDQRTSYAAAPETFGGSFSAQSDVWSIGVVCFILLSQQAPFSGETMYDQIMRCRYSFDDPIWGGVSRDAKDFISKCLEPDQNVRFTVREAMRQRWFLPKVNLNVVPIAPLSEAECERMEMVAMEASFKANAINTIAEISSMEAIINVTQWCLQADKERTGMTTYGELKVGLASCGYSANAISCFYEGLKIDPNTTIEFRDFFAATLESRGRFEEIILTEAFERAFPDENSSISKYELAGLLTSVGTPERVDEFLPDSHWIRFGGVTFKDFLQAYHVQTGKISSKIAITPDFSITLVATVNSMNMLTNKMSSPGAKYKKCSILGGSDCGAVYTVRVDRPVETENEVRVGIGRFMRQRQSTTNPYEEYAMKSFQGTSPEIEYKIRQELLELKKLNQKHLVRIHDTFQEYGQVHVVMDFCTGGNLASRQPYTEQEAGKIIMQILSAVKHLHDHRIIHSALSIETILFETEKANADVKIINFGITRKYLHRPVLEVDDANDCLYAASPESFRGVYTKKGDVWSVGVIAYYLLSGMRPFRGKEWLEKLETADFDISLDRWNIISGEAKSFVASTLILDINKRPEAVRAMTFRWLVRSSIPRGAPSRSASTETGIHTDPSRGEGFRRAGINILAQRLDDRQLLALRKAFHGERNRLCMGTYEDFDLLLREHDHGDIMDEIDSSCSFSKDRSLLSIHVVDLIDEALAARGHVLQDFYQVEFMKETRGLGDGKVSRDFLFDLMESTGVCVAVDDVFDDAASQTETECMAFECFLRSFRRVRSIAIAEDKRLSLDFVAPVLSEPHQNGVDYPENLDKYMKYNILEMVGGIEDIVFKVSNQLNPSANDPENDIQLNACHKSSYALKVYRLNRFDATTARKLRSEMIRELKAIQHLNHIGLASIYNVSTHFSHIQVVSDFCHGGNLGTRLPYSERQIISVINQLLSVLSYLRSNNMILSDFNMENVMFETEDAEAKVKIISFGLSAKYLQQQHNRAEWWHVYCCAPEVIGGRAVEHKSNMWSLGVIAYAMLAGYLPFLGCDMVEQIQRADFNFDHLVWENRSKNAQDFVASLLKVDPDRRPDSKRAGRHRWLRPGRIATDDMNLVLVEDSRSREFDDLWKQMVFQRNIINCLAFHGTTYALFDILLDLRSSSCSEIGFVSTRRLKKSIEDSGHFKDEVISKIFQGIDLERGGLVFDDVISNAGLACGGILEVKIAEVFHATQVRELSHQDLQNILGSDEKGMYRAMKLDDLFRSHEKGTHHRIPFNVFLGAFDRHIRGFFKDLKHNDTVDNNLNKRKFPVDIPGEFEYQTRLHDSHCDILYDHDINIGEGSTPDADTYVPSSRRLDSSDLSLFKENSNSLFEMKQALGGE